MGTPHDLKERVAWLTELLNLKKITESEQGAAKTIRSYYKLNHWAYRRFHSEQGFMHFRVTFDGKKRDSDIFYQPDVVSSYIPEGGSVVELGPGQGANIVYLANKRQDAQFTGFDLVPPKLKNAPPNVTLYKQDYSDLSAYGESFADTAFGIETIVHCPDKDKVFAQVNRVLKPGGVFIVYDYALNRPYESCDETTQTAISLISKGGACPLIESFDDWSGHFERAGFEEIGVKDLSKEIMPDLMHLRRIASRIIDHPKRTKLIFGALPDLFVNNIIVGYLGWDSFEENVISYKEWIYRKSADAPKTSGE